MIIQIDKDRDMWRIHEVRFRPSDVAGYTSAENKDGNAYKCIFTDAGHTILMLQFKHASAKIDCRSVILLESILKRMDEAFGFPRVYPSSAAKAKAVKVGKKLAKKKAKKIAKKKVRK